MPRQTSNTKNPSTSKLSVLVTLLVLLGLLAGLVVNQNRVFDWWRLRGYTPSAQVVSLANDTMMTAYAKHIFYINKPELASDVARFRTDCPENEDTIVLGCYHSSQRGIFVYDVPDASLAGVQQVTAAHETLHAAYDRLSRSDKATLNKQLTDFYEHELTDQRVKDEIKIYQRTEPTEVVNEMHSIFGTEVGQLPAPLEAYYQRYFQDRSKIVSYSQQYQAQFTQRQATIAADDAQLTLLKKEIDSQQAQLNADMQQIATDRAQISAYAAASNYGQYNAAVPAFNSNVDRYNRGIADLQAKIDSYNQLVAARNQLATQLAALDKALDTRVVKQASH